LSRRGKQEEKMQKEILELENILEQELDACLSLEKYIVDKKKFLVKGDIESVMKTDFELQKYNSAVEKLEEKKRQLCPDSNAIKEILENMQERNKAQEIKNLDAKLKGTIANIQKENTITAELIKHALIIVESHVSSIVKAFAPEISHYNSRGKFSKNDEIEVMSSIIHEA
jgi:hypothetical protein